MDTRSADSSIRLTTVSRENSFASKRTHSARCRKSCGSKLISWTEHEENLTLFLSLCKCVCKRVCACRVSKGSGGWGNEKESGSMYTQCAARLGLFARTFVRSHFQSCNLRVVRGPRLAKVQLELPNECFEVIASNVDWEYPSNRLFLRLRL